MGFGVWGSEVGGRSQNTDDTLGFVGFCKISGIDLEVWAGLWEMPEICAGAVVDAAEDAGGDAAGGVVSAAEDASAEVAGGIVSAAADAGLRIADCVQLAYDQATKSSLGKPMPAADHQVV